MKAIFALAVENQPLLAFGVAWLLATGMACCGAYRIGHWRGWRARERASNGAVIKEIERWSGR